MAEWQVLILCHQVEVHCLPRSVMNKLPPQTDEWCGMVVSDQRPKEKSYRTCRHFDDERRNRAIILAE
ncbi:unnamed protein product [Onchocerca flexuosa]|uniref:Transposase n=2 Tax=Onchocerca flexuosa TaxID=387005 RepID=A0A183HAU4_9BILA|nr:unnamed protein product [Onchocerca flexuosa]